jgi:hypothetical protein
MKYYLLLKSIAVVMLVTTLILPSAIAQAQAQSATSTDNATETPRTAEGHPDLSGVWDDVIVAGMQPKRIGASICLFACDEIEADIKSAAPPLLSDEVKAKILSVTDRPTYRPEYAAKVQDLKTRQVEEDPILRCENPGLPRIGPPDKIVQTPTQIVFLYDDVNGNFFRVIRTDSREHRVDVNPSHLGDSIGHWEGDTLVVETVNFNDEAWLKDDGSFHTTDLSVVERLSREGDKLRWQATAYDPEVLAEPWEVPPRTPTLTDIEITEAPPCIDQDLQLMHDTTVSHDNPR